MKSADSRPRNVLLMLVVIAIAPFNCKIRKESSLKESIDLSITPGDEILGYGLRSFQEEKLKKICLVNKQNTENSAKSANATSTEDEINTADSNNKNEVLSTVATEDPGRWESYIMRISEKKTLTNALALSFQGKLSVEGLNVANGTAEAKVNLINNMQFQVDKKYFLVHAQYKKTKETLNPNKITIAKRYRIGFHRLENEVENHANSLAPNTNPDATPAGKISATNTAESPNSPSVQLEDSKKREPRLAPSPGKVPPGEAATKISLLLKECGDMYLESYSVGGEFIGIIETNSESSAQEIEKGLNVKADGTAGKISFDTDSSIKNTIGNLSANSQAKVTMLQIGGCFLGDVSDKCKDSSIQLSPSQAEIPQAEFIAADSDSRLKQSNDKKMSQIDHTNQALFDSDINDLKRNAARFIESVVPHPVALSGRFQSYDRFFNDPEFFSDNIPIAEQNNITHKFVENLKIMHSNLADAWMNLLVIRQYVETAERLNLKKLGEDSSTMKDDFTKKAYKSYGIANKESLELLDVMSDFEWKKCYISFDLCTIKGSKIPDRVESARSRYPDLVSWVKFNLAKDSFYETSSFSHVLLSTPVLRTEFEFKSPGNPLCFAVPDEGLSPTFRLNQNQLQARRDTGLFEKIADSDRETACFWLETNDNQVKAYHIYTGLITNPTPPAATNGIFDKIFGNVPQKCYEVCGQLPQYL